MLSAMSVVASPDRTDDKPKLLVVELWGLGDLSIATPFLRAAAERFSVTVLAKPHALELQPRFWPGVKVVPFVAPWTAFRDKYRLQEWPWRELAALRNRLAAERFRFGISARHDPRDHLLLALFGVERRLGFPRIGSAMFLTDPLDLPNATAHRYEYWRSAGRALGIALPPRDQLSAPRRSGGSILVHSGAGQAVRVWPLERYAKLVRRLRQENHLVSVVCDPDQRDWWLAAGESAVATPHTVKELMAVLDGAASFIGNDSGGGHLAVLGGLPTFTIFGPQLSEWFAPLHPDAAWIEGKPCPHKPCFDYCRFPTPHCIVNITEEEVWAGVLRFLQAIGGGAREN